MTRVVRLPDVIAQTGLSRSKLYVLMDAKMFPRPISLGGRAVAWVESEIEDWIHCRIADRDAA